MTRKNFVYVWYRCSFFQLFFTYGWWNRGCRTQRYIGMTVWNKQVNGNLSILNCVSTLQTRHLVKCQCTNIKLATLTLPILSTLLTKHITKILMCYSYIHLLLSLVGSFLQSLITSFSSLHAFNFQHTSPVHNKCSINFGWSEESLRGKVNKMLVMKYVWITHSILWKTWIKQGI
jgi:hypothetical protein